MSHLEKGELIGVVFELCLLTGEDVLFSKCIKVYNLTELKLRRSDF